MLIKYLVNAHIKFFEKDGFQNYNISGATNNCVKSNCLLDITYFITYSLSGKYSITT